MTDTREIDPSVTVPDPETECSTAEASSDPTAGSPGAVLPDSRGQHALGDARRIGDAGRQGEVQANPGLLSTGVSDTELDFLSVSGLEVRACSSRGASHRHAGLPRQDAHCLAADDDWLVACVADGVSSGPHSQVAAQTAARAVCKLALDGAAGGAPVDWTALANRVSRRILEEARFRRLVDLADVDDSLEQVRRVRTVMSTTAVLVVVGRHPDEAGTVPATIVVLAGDSGAYKFKGGALTPLVGGKDLDEEISSTSVHPLPGPALPVVLEAGLGRGEALFLTSDGIGDPLGDGAGEVGDVLASRWNSPPTAVDFFRDVNFLRRSFDDDRTVVGIWNLPPHRQEPS